MSWLEKGKYLESPRGHFDRHSWRKWYRRLCFEFSIEPKSKNAMSISEKILFQEEILKQMSSQFASLKKHAFRGNIAARFVLTCTSQTPPHIHTAMKNLLDLFGKPLPGTKTRRKGLAYYDDRQIKYLSVSYYVGKTAPSIYVTFAPLEHFLSDISFAERILNEKWPLKIDNHRDYTNFLREIGENKTDDFFIEDHTQEAYEHYCDLRDRNSAWSIIEDENAYKMFLRKAQTDVQKYQLRNYRIQLTEIYHLYRASGLAKPYREYNNSLLEERLRKYSVDMSKIFEKFPIRIKLPGIPKKNGETKIFKEAVRKMMQHFYEKNPILVPLYIPIGLEGIFKPPKTSESFSKDLDNIMRLILPIFHEVFKPPVTTFANEDDIEMPLIKELVQGIPKSVRNSVARYDIMEVSRHEGDGEDGYINLGIYGDLATGHFSIWDRVDGVIEKWHDAIDDQLDYY